MIRVLHKMPGEDARMVEIENTLEAFQRAVDGYIEGVRIATDCAVVCNEEGRLLGMDYNCRICGVDFVGPVVIAGVKRDEFTDVPVGVTDFEEWMLDDDGI